MYGLKHFAMFAVGCLIGWAIGNDGGHWMPLVLWVAVSIGGWGFSCWRHPMRPCRLCKGRGRHRGIIFWYADRECLNCHGDLRFRRLGSRLFNFTEKSPAS